MKTAKKTTGKYSSYRDFYEKVVQEIRSADTKKDIAAKKALLNKLEVTMKGKDMVIEGNLAC